MINKILKLNVKKIDNMNNIDDEKIRGNFIVIILAIRSAILLSRIKVAFIN